MTQVLNRLRRMTRDEVSWRARTAARIAADRIAMRVRPRGWRRDDIRAVLAPDVIDAPLDVAMAAGRWDAVHNRLAQRIRERQSAIRPRPRVSPGALRRRWFGATRRPRLERRNGRMRSSAGRYDLLGYRGLTFAGTDGRVDWHLDPVHHARAPLRFWADVPYLDPAIGDHKIIWELNRHQHWLALGRALWLTGDARYGRAHDRRTGRLARRESAADGHQLGEHARAGLPLDVMDLGAALPAGPHPAPRRDPAPSIAPGSSTCSSPSIASSTHIEQNLSIYFSPNTHLTGEALALYVAGVALPELAGSRRWRDTGRRILLEEIDRQILADGGHAERSTHYHRYTLDFYLMALLTARRDGDADAERRFTDACLRLAEFARAMADANGRLPLIGDDDGGMLWPFAGRVSRSPASASRWTP